MDGIRGVAIILVVLNHMGASLWPDAKSDNAGVYAVPFLRGLLGGGAVVIFFVIGGFIVTYGLLRERERGIMDPVRFLLRRLVRLGIQLSMLAVVLMLVQRFDSTAPGTMLQLVQNLGNVFTYTFNLWAVDNLLLVRSDVGHLWYLSVQQQCYLVLPLFVLAFHRWRVVACLLLIVGIALVYWERQVAAEDDWLAATILTTTRSDGLLWGVLLAFALPLLARFRHWSWVLLLAILGAIGCQLVLQELGENAFLGVWSLAYQFAIGAVIVAIWLQARPSITSRAMSWAPLTWMGRNSLSLYFWHLPVMDFLARHGEHLTWWAQTMILVVSLVALSAVLERFVEEPTRKLLARHPLFRARTEEKS